MREWPIAVCVLLGCAGATPTATSGTADPDYYRPSETLTPDRVYSPTIRTVQCFKAGFELAAPIIELGSNEQVVLRFDDLAPDIEDLSYTLVHCDHAWQPSDLPVGTYVEGAGNAYLPPGRQSYNTLQNFIHYELVLPNMDMRPMRSGNYLIKVYRGGDEEDLVLTRRMLVMEPVTSINARVAPTRQVDLRDAAQQVDLTINTNNLPVQDPFGELHVTILQNFRWDDARTGAQPRFVRGSELVYDFPDQALFMGGNEFRNFDLKDQRFITNRIERIVPGLGQRVYDAWLLPEAPRTIRRYNSQQDINGKYLVRNDMVDGDPLGADYFNVHFVLPMEAPLMQEPYVYGQLSDWQCQPAFRMQWDAERKAYHAAILLKQGFYDFSYVTLARETGAADITTVEGSHFETENDYTVLLYFTDRMQRLDRLVGVRWVNSRR
ncbi:MAG: DUF5103 domain-containing protein [Flavobacteriales bacterium]|nr:DUF5103 domain-containing protein [Flavobacteriales bacterium]